MQTFDGFPEGSKLSPTAFPALFFSQLLPMIDDLAELKVTLYCFWALSQKPGLYRYLCRRDFMTDETLLDGLRAVAPNTDAESVLDTALRRALERGTLLCTQIDLDSGAETLYFVNTERGRAAIQQLQAGAWRPGDEDCPVEILPERPNIYRLYEANIGVLTPMIGDALKDAEKDYPANWIEDAIREAVASNKRNWRYIQSILKRWERQGRDRSGRPAGQDGAEYVSGQFADFIEH